MCLLGYPAVACCLYVVTELVGPYSSLCMSLSTTHGTVWPMCCLR